MNIPIEPIQYGLDQQAILVEIKLAERDLISEVNNLKLLFKDSNNNLLFSKEFTINKIEYYNLGSTVDERITQLLFLKGIVRKQIKTIL